MKQLVVFGLVAAIGAVAVINEAGAQSPQGLCQSNPSAPECQGTGVGTPNEGGAVNMNSQNNGIRSSNRNYNGYRNNGIGAYHGAYHNGVGTYNNGAGSYNNGVGTYNNGDGSYNGNGAPNDWRYRHHRGYGYPGYYGFGNEGYYGYNQPEIYFNFGLGIPDYRNRCTDIAFRLRNRGFTNVRAISCSGGTYAYYARRDGQRLKVYVSAASGRIRGAVRY